MPKYDAYKIKVSDEDQTKIWKEIVEKGRPKHAVYKEFGISANTGNRIMNPRTYN